MRPSKQAPTVQQSKAKQSSERASERASAGNAIGPKQGVAFAPGERVQKQLRTADSSDTTRERSRASSPQEEEEEEEAVAVVAAARVIRGERRGAGCPDCAGETGTAARKQQRVRSEVPIKKLSSGVLPTRTCLWCSAAADTCRAVGRRGGGGGGGCGCWDNLPGQDDRACGIVFRLRPLFVRLDKLLDERHRKLL